MNSSTDTSAQAIAQARLLVSTAVARTPKRNTIIILSLPIPSCSPNMAQPTAAAVAAMVLSAFLSMKSPRKAKKRSYNVFYIIASQSFIVQYAADIVLTAGYDNMFVFSEAVIRACKRFYACAVPHADDVYVVSYPYAQLVYPLSNPV